jgi:poly-gamma-glutamate synthesis protein (capsule biosynthesis protein)
VEGTIRIALAGDTMLGRGVADLLEERPPESLVDDAVASECRRADLAILNLECCISGRGTRWPDPQKPFFFRAPPTAVRTLEHLGIGCVTLANNHALDFGPDALLDTLDHLAAAGIAAVGAGADRSRARAPLVLERNGFRLRVVGATDHPAAYAAGRDRPGVAYADLRRGVPGWLLEAARPGPDADAVLVTLHWGPNMTTEPLPYVRRAAAALVRAGATLVAGHSAHLFHGVQDRVLFDLGDFLDDYAVDPALRNDLGMLWLVTLSRHGPERIEGLPLRLEYGFTRFARGDDAAWIRRRMREACRPFGTVVTESESRLVISPAGS